MTRFYSSGLAFLLLIGILGSFALSANGDYSTECGGGYQFGQWNPQEFNCSTTVENQVAPVVGVGASASDAEMKKMVLQVQRLDCSFVPGIVTTMGSRLFDSEERKITSQNVASIFPNDGLMVVTGVAMGAKDEGDVTSVSLLARPIPSYCVMQSEKKFIGIQDGSVYVSNEVDFQSKDNPQNANEIPFTSVPQNYYVVGVGAHIDAGGEVSSIGLQSVALRPPLIASCQIQGTNQIGVKESATYVVKCFASNGQELACPMDPLNNPSGVPGNGGYGDLRNKLTWSKSSENISFEGSNEGRSITIETGSQTGPVTLRVNSADDLDYSPGKVSYGNNGNANKTFSIPMIPSDNIESFTVNRFYFNDGGRFRINGQENFTDVTGTIGGDDIPQINGVKVGLGQDQSRYKVDGPYQPADSRYGRQVQTQNSYPLDFSRYFNFNGTNQLYLEGRDAAEGGAAEVNFFVNRQPFTCSKTIEVTDNPTVPSCINPKANASICTGDADGLIQDTVGQAVTTCSATQKCEYTCNTGYVLSGGECVPVEPANSIAYSSTLFIGNQCFGGNSPYQFTENKLPPFMENNYNFVYWTGSVNYSNGTTFAPFTETFTGGMEFCNQDVVDSSGNPTKGPLQYGIILDAFNEENVRYDASIENPEDFEYRLVDLSFDPNIAPKRVWNLVLVRKSTNQLVYRVGVSAQPESALMITGQLDGPIPPTFIGATNTIFSISLDRDHDGVADTTCGSGYTAPANSARYAYLNLTKASITTNPHPIDQCDLRPTQNVCMNQPYNSIRCFENAIPSFTQNYQLINNPSSCEANTPQNACRAYCAPGYRLNEARTACEVEPSPQYESSCHIQLADEDGSVLCTTDAVNSDTGRCLLLPGETYQVTGTATNTGNTPWPPAGEIQTEFNFNQNPTQTNGQDAIISTSPFSTPNDEGHEEDVEFTITHQDSQIGFCSIPFTLTNTPPTPSQTCQISRTDGQTGPTYLPQTRLDYRVDCFEDGKRIETGCQSPNWSLSDAPAEWAIGPTPNAYTNTLQSLTPNNKTGSGRLMVNTRTDKSQSIWCNTNVEIRPVQSDVVIVSQLQQNRVTINPDTERARIEGSLALTILREPDEPLMYALQLLDNEGQVVSMAPLAESNCKNPPSAFTNETCTFSFDEIEPKRFYSIRIVVSGVRLPGGSIETVLSNNTETTSRFYIGNGQTVAPDLPLSAALFVALAAFGILLASQRKRD